MRLAVNLVTRPVLVSAHVERKTRVFTSDTDSCQRSVRLQGMNCAADGIAPKSQPALPRGIGPTKIWSKALLPVTLLVSVLLLAGCATGPMTQFVVEETYVMESVGDTSRQTQGRVTVIDQGEPSFVASPVRVQACDGSRLLFRTVKETSYSEEQSEEDQEKETRIRRLPIFEEVNPLEGLYLRQLEIRNDTRHVLSLRRIEAVLLDAAGNDNEGISKAELGHYLRHIRPCHSTEELIDRLRSVKFLGSNIQLRPGRSGQVFVAFPGIDQRILGDWTLELYGVPVETNEAGEVSRVSSFAFPLLSRGYRTTRELYKDTTFGPWREIKRSVVEIESGIR